MCDARESGADFSPTKEPIFSPNGNGSNLPLNMIGIDGHIWVLKKDVQCVFSF